MVSAAKLRRAQEAMFAARPYARKMMEVLNSLATRADPDAHPLLAGARRRARCCWSWSPRTRGCAAASTPTSSAPPRASSSEQRGGASCRLELRRGARRGTSSSAGTARSAREHVGVFQRAPVPGRASAIAARLIDAYVEREVDRVYIALQRVQDRDPAEAWWSSGSCPSRKLSSTPRSRPSDYIYEPAPGAIFARCCPSTSRSRSGGRCSSRRRPSTARAWRRWTPPPTTRGT